MNFFITRGALARRADRHPLVPWKSQRQAASQPAQPYDAIQKVLFMFFCWIDSGSCVCFLHTPKTMFRIVFLLVSMRNANSTLETIHA